MVASATEVQLSRARLEMSARDARLLLRDAVARFSDAVMVSEIPAAHQNAMAVALDAELGLTRLVDTLVNERES